MAKDAIDEALKGVNDAEKAFLDQIEQAHKGLKEKEKEAKARFEQMRRELAAKRKEQLSEEQKKNLAKKVDDEKEGIFSRFGDWMHNLAHNSMNAIRKLLGMSPREDKWKKEQVQQAQTVQQQPAGMDQDLQKTLQDLQKTLAQLMAKIDDFQKKIEEQNQRIEQLEKARGQEKVSETEVKGQSQDQQKAQPEQKPAPEAKNHDQQTAGQPEKAKGQGKGPETEVKGQSQDQQKAQPEQKPAPEPKKAPEAEKAPEPKKAPEAKNNAPANNIVTGGRLTPLVDINNVPDKYKDVVNSKELLTPNDFMAAFVYTALKNRDLNQKFKGMFDNLRKEDSESHVAPGSDIDYIGAFAWQALEYSIKTKSTAVACKSPRNVQCLAYPKESFDFHLNVKKLKSELCRFTGEGCGPDWKDFNPEKYGAPQAEEMAKYITQVLENMDKSLQKGMNLQPAEMREVVKANSVEAINHFMQQGMSRKQAIDDVYNRYLKTWKHNASAVISDCIYRASSEDGLKLWHERVANVPEKAAAIDAGFIDRNGERNSLASIRKNRFTGVLKEVPQSVQEKITEDRKAHGLIR